MSNNQSNNVDFDGINKTVKGLNAGMQLWLAQECLRNALMSFMYYDNELAPELNELVGAIKKFRATNKVANENRMAAFERKSGSAKIDSGERS